MTRRGSCLCGAVTYDITSDITATAACHCGMCQTWSGGVFLGVQVPKDAMVITGTPQIYSSSPWAQRAFCGTCGANLWYQVTAPGPYQGTYHVAFGGLQDKDGIDLREEIYIDRKPDAFSFAQKTKTMTQAEVEAMFAPPN